MDEDSDPDFSDMLDALKIAPEDLSILSDDDGGDPNEEEIISAGESECGSNDDSGRVRKRLDELAFETMKSEAGLIYSALISHYGDVNYLFVSLWNSTLPLFEVESAAIILRDAPLEKQKAFLFVADEMRYLY